MITVALSATIGAPPERVWNALIDPAQREAWDERVLGEVAVPRDRTRSASRARTGTDTPTPLRETRWRFRLGNVPVVMRDQILSADRGDRLVSRISIGSMHFDQTLTLHVDDDETGPRTRLGMKLVGRNSIAVIGEVVPRLDVQKMLIEYADTTLRQIQKYCEADA